MYGASSGTKGRIKSKGFVMVSCFAVIWPPPCVSGAARMLEPRAPLLAAERVRSERRYRGLHPESGLSPTKLQPERRVEPEPSRTEFQAPTRAAAGRPGPRCAAAIHASRLSALRVQQTPSSRYRRSQRRCPALSSPAGMSPKLRHGVGDVL